MIRTIGFMISLTILISCKARDNSTLLATASDNKPRCVKGTLTTAGVPSRDAFLCKIEGNRPPVFVVAPDQRTGTCQKFNIVDKSLLVKAGGGTYSINVNQFGVNSSPQYLTANTSQFEPSHEETQSWTIEERSALQRIQRGDFGDPQKTQETFLKNIRYQKELDNRSTPGIGNCFY